MITKIKSEFYLGIFLLGYIALMGYLTEVYPTTFFSKIVLSSLVLMVALEGLLLWQEKDPERFDIKLPSTSIYLLAPLQVFTMFLYLYSIKLHTTESILDIASYWVGIGLPIVIISQSLTNPNELNSQQMVEPLRKSILYRLVGARPVSTEDYVFWEAMHNRCRTICQGAEFILIFTNSTIYFDAVAPIPIPIGELGTWTVYPFGILSLLVSMWAIRHYGKWDFR